jgi:hypothetical protein
MYQQTIPCPQCGAQNLRGQWVCAHCGVTLLAYCPVCQAGNASDSQFCHACRAPLPQAGSSPAPTQYPGPSPQQPPHYSPGNYQDPAAYQYQQPYQNPGQGYPEQPPYPPYQQYPDGYTQYHDYHYQPGYGGGAPQAGTTDGLSGQVINFVRTTNPILLSALVVLIVGMAIFFVLAFQFGWIKTAAPPKAAAVTDKTPPQISLVKIREGEGRSAIISWVTDEQSSSQIEYGIWPYANTTTPVQNDPSTGANAGVFVHEVGLTNLLPRSSYSYRVISTDKYGNKGKGPDMQFDTTP